MLRDAARWIRSTFVSIPIILVATILASTVALVFGSLAPRRHRQRVVDSTKRVWARLILAASFVRVVAKGLEAVPRSHPLVFCANHLSYLDPPILIAALPVPVRFLAKKSLFAIPFLGWAMRLEGDLPIDRDNARAAARGLVLAQQRLIAGTSFVVFPEGGRSPDGLLQTFMSGAFRLAIAAGVPIVPIGLRETREALRPGSLFLRGGRVQISIGKPILTAGLASKDADALSRQVEDRIRNLLVDDRHDARSSV